MPSKVDGVTSTRNVKDIGITDFYTFVSTTGELDASMEDIFALIEGEASSVNRELLNPFRPLRRLTDEQAGNLAHRT